MLLKNNKSIAILLPIYNGELYLRELLESLLSQTCTDYNIYIRDDGSRDESHKIIENYAAKYNNIYILPFEKNYGARYSFLALMNSIISDYYMFCDQDDIWLSTKIEETYNKMKEEEIRFPFTPIVVHTDLKVVDSNLNTISESFWAFMGYNVSLPHSFEYICHFNDIIGCTMMINYLAKQSCRGIMDLQFPDFMYYDNMICVMTAKDGGKIIPLKKQTIIYRRHNNNETDALKFGESIVNNLQNLKSYLTQQKQRHKFFKQIGYGSFKKFMFYKIKLYLIKRWKLKHV